MNILHSRDAKQMIVNRFTIGHVFITFIIVFMTKLLIAVSFLFDNYINVVSTRRNGMNWNHVTVSYHCVTHSLCILGLGLRVTGFFFGHSVHLLFRVLVPLFRCSVVLPFSIVSDARPHFIPTRREFIESTKCINILHWPLYRCQPFICITAIRSRQIYCWFGTGDAAKIFRGEKAKQMNT